jgi:hypothetical protein
LRGTGQDGDVAWQQQMIREVSARLPAGAELEVVGSAGERSLVDGWSDLDLHLRLPHAVELAHLLHGSVVWASEVTESPEEQVVRAVLADGRRLDLVIETGRLLLPVLVSDNDVRFLAALAVCKLGRHDRLIGMHLVLELLQACLVQAMLLRDRDEGTSVHRTGTRRDHLAAEVGRIARLPLDVAVRPNVVERIVDLYGQWRGQLETGYVPDWSGLEAVVARGLGESDGHRPSRDDPPVTEA